jgi:hypothetical protein
MKNRKQETGNWKLVNDRFSISGLLFFMFLFGTGSAGVRRTGGPGGGPPIVMRSYFFSARASSSSMTALKFSAGCAPLTRRPLMIKAGVTVTTTLLPSA